MKSAYEALLEIKTELARGVGVEIQSVEMSRQTGDAILRHGGVNSEITGKNMTTCMGIPVVIKRLQGRKLMIVNYIQTGIKSSKPVYFDE